MNKLVPIGLGSAAVVVALVASSQLLTSPAPGGIGGAPSASPTATPSPTPEPSVASPSPVAGLPEGPFVVREASEVGPPITVTIPASGWTHDRQLASLSKGEDVANLPEAAILFWLYPVGTGFYVYGNPCQWESTRPDTLATTTDDIVAALAAQASRDASTPANVTVGGYAGKAITLHVPSDAAIEGEDFTGCDQGKFASFGIPDDDPSRFHQGPGQIDELWILDLDGAIVVIDAMYRPNTPADLIEEMRAIAESATFEQGGGS